MPTNAMLLPASLPLPRERILAHGGDSLSDLELLALLLGSGPRAPAGTGPAVFSVARELLERFGSLPSVLTASPCELAAIRGMGPAKRATLLGVFEVARRLPRAREDRLGRVESSRAAFAWFARLAFEAQEVVAVLALSARHHVLAYREVFRGTAAGAPGRPREILREALRHDAVRLVVAHNHPSGDPAPSVEDRRFTRELKEACRWVHVPLLDHLVIGRSSAAEIPAYFSFADAGEVP